MSVPNAHRRVATFVAQHGNGLYRIQLRRDEDFAGLIGADFLAPTLTYAVTLGASPTFGKADAHPIFRGSSPAARFNSWPQIFFCEVSEPGFARG
jgi:hypothetical protein